MTYEDLGTIKDYGTYTWYGQEDKIREYKQPSFGIANHAWRAAYRKDPAMGSKHRGWGWSKPTGFTSTPIIFQWAGARSMPAPVIDIEVKVYDLTSYEQKFLIDRLLAK